jgi:hypothetical protein
LKQREKESSGGLVPNNKSPIPCDSKRVPIPLNDKDFGEHVPSKVYKNIPSSSHERFKTFFICFI